MNVDVDVDVDVVVVVDGDEVKAAEVDDSSGRELMVTSGRSLAWSKRPHVALVVEVSGPA